MARHYSYRHVDEDGDLHGMRSTVSVLNDQMDSLAVNGFSQLGFLLNNGVRVIGPCAMFPRSVLQWNVRSHKCQFFCCWLSNLIRLCYYVLQQTSGLVIYEGLPDVCGV